MAERETDWQVLDRLMAVIESRRDGNPDASYVARLFDKGRTKIAQKVGEEGLEAAIAAATGDNQAVVSESADLLFHLLVLWAEAGIAPQTVLDELARREGTSGIAEKASRPS